MSVKQRHASTFFFLFGGGGEGVEGKGGEKERQKV